MEDRNQVVITKHGRGAAVIIDFGEYEEYEKFLHEKYVERKLAESLKEAQDPNTKWLTRQEFWEKVDKVLVQVHHILHGHRDIQKFLRYENESNQKQESEPV